jgi:hypothetical protein
MRSSYCHLLLLQSLSLSFSRFEVNANSSDDFYTAAVVEFTLPTSPHATVTNVEGMVEETLDEYSRLINEAAESGADILAFPEGTLNYAGIATRKLLIEHAVELSDGDIRNSTVFDNKCDYSRKSPVSEEPSASVFDLGEATKCG